MENKTFTTTHVKELIFGLSLQELAEVYELELTDATALQMLIDRVKNDLTDGTYSEISYEQ